MGDLSRNDKGELNNLESELNMGGVITLTS